VKVVVAIGGDVPQQGHAACDALCASSDLVIAADGGLRHLGQFDQAPDVVVGDLDSADPTLVDRVRDQGAEVIVHPADKDETDFELALCLAVERGASEITVIGLFGGRVDHEVANITLVAQARWHRQHHCRLGAYDGLRSMWVVHEEQTLHEPTGRTISLIPWNGDALGVTTSGLRYPLDDETLIMGSSRGMSNVAEAETQRVTVGRGCVLVFIDPSEDAID